MKTYANPTVRGEAVRIIAEHSDEEKIVGTLGAVLPDAHILVEYPDGERGYIPEKVIQDAE